jgi:hypothetical protein
MVADVAAPELPYMCVYQRERHYWRRLARDSRAVALPVVPRETAHAEVCMHRRRTGAAAQPSLLPVRLKRSPTL